MKEVEHFIRFGSHKERKILKSLMTQNCVFNLALNANVVTNTPSAIQRMLDVGFPKCDFFIDPQTYIIQLDPLRYYSSQKIIDGVKQTVLKNSVDRLLKEYGEPVQKIRSEMKKMRVDDIKGNIEEFTEKTINFQDSFLETFRRNDAEDDGFDDYDDVLTEGVKPKYWQRKNSAGISNRQAVAILKRSP